jgi:hypothetical protein
MKEFTKEELRLMLYLVCIALESEVTERDGEDILKNVNLILSEKDTENLQEIGDKIYEEINEKL